MQRQNQNQKMSKYKKEEQLSANIDWVMVLLYLVLILFGWVTIYSAVYQEENQNIFSSLTNSGKQFQWMIVSCVIGFILLIVDSKFFSTFAYVIYTIMCIALVGVIFLGVEVKGQRNWIRFGGFQIQPSELAKVAACLAVAKYLGTLNVDIRKWKDKWRTFALAGLPMLIILVQGDAGSAIVFAALVLAFFREGLEPYFLIVGTSVAVISVLALLIPNYIFIGEEFGFVGCTILIGVFLALFYRILFLAERQRSKFSRVYGYCVASILFFHFLINVGMAIGVAPVIGIPLPFISYGGSSLLSFTILLFLFIRMDSQRMEAFR
ncbi:unnamed protein product [Darwinula stevensoni]|uniref:Rod shape-determining protein RodA n=1 Tax=Darwinula stevensoni TaxID=69355 RepID=A0A7R9AH94_9CRUS|nr:unnamed protein product [Darwinula stevensoni]CAG0905450.1 unnamed protein product [Darwinula stevensoni]